MRTFDKHLEECLKDKKFKKLFEEELKLARIMVAIQEEREKKGMSQADVAKEAHITQQQMSKIENGENCTLSTLLKVCQALGLELVIQKSSPQSYIGVAEEKAEYNKK
jgi:transcriptional regulator with XRE-family HTH domain